MQREFASTWQEELACQNGEGLFDGRERQKPLIQDLFWCLLHEMIESELSELSKTVWDFVQLLGTAKGFGTDEYESRSIPRPYPYLRHDPSQLDACLCEESAS